MIDDCQLCESSACSGLIAPSKSNLQVQVCFFWQRKELLMDSSFSVKHECQTKKHLGLYSAEFPAWRSPAMEALGLGTCAAWAWFLFPKFCGPVPRNLEFCRGLLSSSSSALPQALLPLFSHLRKPMLWLPKWMPPMEWSWKPTLRPSADSAPGHLGSPPVPLRKEWRGEHLLGSEVLGTVLEWAFRPSWSGITTAYTVFCWKVLQTQTTKIKVKMHRFRKCYVFLWVDLWWLGKRSGLRTWLLMCLTTKDSDFSKNMASFTEHPEDRGWTLLGPNW